MKKAKALKVDGTPISKKALQKVLLQNMSPREAWVLEAAEGFVIRKKISRLYYNDHGDAWWTSPVIDREMALYAAENLDYTHGFYAVRHDSHGEMHMSYIDRKKIGDIENFVRQIPAHVDNIRREIQNMTFTILNMSQGAKPQEQAKAIAQTVAEYIAKREKEKEETNE